MPFFCFLFLSSSPAFSLVITSDTTWSGDVSVSEDVLVPAGVTLTIAAGTVVHITPADSTKTDPEFLSALTEITVRGTLLSNGKNRAPVSFVLKGGQKASWAGIIVDGGRAVLNYSRISSAETGVYVPKGSLTMSNSLLTQNRYGLAVQGREASAKVISSEVKGNDYGVFLLNSAQFDSRENTISGNRKKDTYTATAKDYPVQVMEYTAEHKAAGRVFSDEVVLGTAVWQGRIEVRGIVRVPENSRLIILPGTVVEFSRKDTNGDGIGENGLLIQGSVIAKGTREKPIIMRSAEKQRKMGDWDAINIMNSDASQNLIEHCQIEDAYRGLHFHFSNAAVIGSVLRNNYRGVQFQESVVEIRSTHFYGNKSAFQARDSDIVFTDNVVHHNYSGMNVFRNNITISGNIIMSNSLEGLRVREGLPVVEKNLIDSNRHGIMVSDALYGTYSSNVISHNLESGISLRGTEGIEISGNAIQSNGINGMNIQDSGAVIQSNLISDNADRGIGVQSFQGVITGNNILKNGTYNLGIDGDAEVRAEMNWWGGEDMKEKIYDREDDPSRGRAVVYPVMDRPVVFAWPLRNIRTDSFWHADMLIRETVTAEKGAELVISPNARVLFDQAAGLIIKGKILAKGEDQAAISFSASQGNRSGTWDEILLDHATGSVFSNCLFEHATWAVHSHFTDLKVEGCLFRSNTGGLRFTSGPLEIRRSVFMNNEIGIRAFRGTAAISGNHITGNATGIFVREKGGGLTVTKNNIFANSEHNIRLGDFNDQDVNARDNWWSSPEPADTIFDSRKEPGIGTVHYEPFARQPFELGLPRWMPVEKERRNAEHPAGAAR